MNPEFRRNLWLQLSPQRLIAAPVALGIVFGLAWLTAPEWLGGLGRTIFYLLIGFWGTRRAADTLAEETAGGTWDGQRLSSLGAWAMSWGKLLGGTSFVWYAGLIALAVALRFSAAWPSPGPLLFAAATAIASGLLGQTVALAAILALRRKMPAERRLPVTFSQLLGLVAIALTYQIGRVPLNGEMTIEWFGWALPPSLFGLGSILAFLAWALLATFRLMRVELQFRALPWAWIGFALFLMLYGEGLVYGALRREAAPASAWLAVPVTVAGMLVYAALFAEPKSIIAYRGLVAALRRGDGRRAGSLLPLWLPTYVIFAGLAVAFAIALGAAEWPAIDLWANAPFGLASVGRFAPVWTTVVATALFVLRDVLFVLWLNFSAQRRRADLAALLYLALAYGPLAALLAAIPAPLLLGFFLPMPAAHAAMTIVPVAAEVVVLLFLLRRRWAAAERSLQPLAQPAA
jgi:hypothetical protein